MINELPTAFEIVAERKHVKEKPTADSGSKSRGSTKVLLSLCYISASCINMLTVKSSDY